MDFGQRCRVARKAQGMRREQVANACGINPTTLWRIEECRNQPRLALAKRIATVLGIELWDAGERGSPSAASRARQLVSNALEELAREGAA